MGNLVIRMKCATLEDQLKHLQIETQVQDIDSSELEFQPRRGGGGGGGGPFRAYQELQA